jgi:hypothetical protein
MLFCLSVFVTIFFVFCFAGLSRLLRLLSKRNNATYRQYMEKWLENLVTEIEAKTQKAQAQFWLDQNYSYAYVGEVTRCISVLIVFGLQFFQCLLSVYIVVPCVYSFSCTKPNLTHCSQHFMFAWLPNLFLPSRRPIWPSSATHNAMRCAASTACDWQCTWLLVFSAHCSTRSQIRFCTRRVQLQAVQLLTLQSSLVTLCTTYCNNEKICVFFYHTAYSSFPCDSRGTNDYFPNCINRLAFRMDTRSVLCEVGPEALYIT